MLAEPIRAGDLIFQRGSIPTRDKGHVGIAGRWIVAPSAARRSPFDRSL